jgi:hypothetical protein
MFCTSFCTISIFKYWTSTNTDTVNQSSNKEVILDIPEAIQIASDSLVPSKEKNDEGQVFENPREWENLMKNLNEAKQWLYDEENNT